MVPLQLCGVGVEEDPQRGAHRNTNMSALPCCICISLSTHLHRLAGSAEARPEAAMMAGPIEQAAPPRTCKDPTQKEENKWQKKERKNRKINTTTNCKEIEQTLLICQKKPHVNNSIYLQCMRSSTFTWRPAATSSSSWPVAARRRTRTAPRGSSTSSLLMPPLPGRRQSPAAASVCSSC